MENSFWLIKDPQAIYKENVKKYLYIKLSTPVNRSKN
jgi:hypothetical protein